MATITFQKLWDSHPYPASPCDKNTFENQCAIRIGVALEKAGVNTSTFKGAKCYPNFNHNPKHILRAQELAEWLETQTSIFGACKKYRSVTSKDFSSKKGIVFVKDGWGATDHIDLWDGSEMKGGNPSYFSLGREVWFWELS
jgi:hypothetical protein